MADLMRVSTELTGPNVVGGGISQLYFNDSYTLRQDVVDAVVAFWNLINDHVVAGNVMTVLGDIEVIDSDTGDLQFVTTAVGATINGALSSGPLPNATQGLIRWRTGVTGGVGREIRGRMFVPCPGDADNAEGTPTSGYIADLNTAAEGLGLSEDVHLVVYSPTKHTAAEVISASTWSKWAVLRSRRD